MRPTADQASPPRRPARRAPRLPAWPSREAPKQARAGTGASRAATPPERRGACRPRRCRLRQRPRGAPEQRRGRAGDGPEGRLIRCRGPLRRLASGHALEAARRRPSGVSRASRGRACRSTKSKLGSRGARSSSCRDHRGCARSGAGYPGASSSSPTASRAARWNPTSCSAARARRSDRHALQRTTCRRDRGVPSSQGRRDRRSAGRRRTCQARRSGLLGTGTGGVERQLHQAHRRGPGDVISINEGHVYPQGAGKSTLSRAGLLYPRMRTSPECNFPTPITIPARTLVHDGGQPWRIRRQQVLGARPHGMDHRRSLRHLLASRPNRNPLDHRPAAADAGRSRSEVHGRVDTRPTRSRARRRAGAAPAGGGCSRFDRRARLPMVAGADEAGRGCLAGPLVAAGVLFDYRRAHHPRVARARRAERLQAAHSQGAGGSSIRSCFAAPRASRSSRAARAGSTRAGCTRRTSPPSATRCRGVTAGVTARSRAWSTASPCPP